MIAAKCSKCGNIGCTGSLCGYKTMHENAANINPYSVEEQVRQKILKLRRDIFKLKKYYHSLNGDLQVSSVDEYVLLSDILALFSVKND